MNELAAFLVGLITMGVLWFYADYYEKTSAYHRGIEAGRRLPISWTPASENPQEEWGRYLTIVKYESVDGYEDVETEYAEWNNGQWDVISLHCGKIESVLAWMPLPEPYREGEQRGQK